MRDSGPTGRLHRSGDHEGNGRGPWSGVDSRGDRESPRRVSYSVFDANGDPYDEPFYVYPPIRVGDSNNISYSDTISEYPSVVFTVPGPTPRGATITVEDCLGRTIGTLIYNPADVAFYGE
jgi:hypothetical protein